MTPLQTWWSTSGARDAPSDLFRAALSGAPSIGPRGERVRHKRHFSANDSAALLSAIGECRRACVDAHRKAPIGGPIYRAVSRLMEEIDLMAEALTGDRRHFWLKPPTSFGSPQPQGPRPDNL